MLIEQLELRLKNRRGLKCTLQIEVDGSPVNMQEVARTSKRFLRAIKVSRQDKSEMQISAMLHFMLVERFTVPRDRILVGFYWGRPPVQVMPLSIEHQRKRA